MQKYNSKSLLNSFDVKVYILLKVICLSDGDAKHGGPFRIFDTVFFSEPPSFYMYHSSHYATVKHIHISILRVNMLCNLTSQRGAKYKMDHPLVPILSKACSNAASMKCLALAQTHT